MSIIDIAGLILKTHLANQFWSNLKRKKKSSPPKFRKVRRYKLFTLKQAGWKLDKERGQIRIASKWYGYFQSRKIEGKVKTVTIKRNNVGDIYIYLVCDSKSEIVKHRTGKSVGFDFGLKTFLTGSEGSHNRSQAMRRICSDMS